MVLIMKKNMDDVFSVFDDYVLKYDLNEERIAYKYGHSYRVEHQAEMICHDLNLSEDDMYLAGVIGLLHDIARFKQWTLYKSFDDNDSFDHGDMAVTILDEELKNYNVRVEDYDIIKIAIKNHNKYEIEDNLKERELLHSEIIRDADKLDIFYAISTGKLIHIDDCCDDISENIKKNFYNHMQINSSDINNTNDKIVGTLSMIYDLNFEYSKERILREKYLDKIYHNLNNKEIFKPYFSEIKKYLKGEI